MITVSHVLAAPGRRHGGPGIAGTVGGWLAPVARWLAHHGLPAPLATPAAWILAIFAVIVVLRMLAAAVSR